MLHIPEGSPNNSCIIGIDPGSETMGVAKLEYDIQRKEIVRTTVNTYTASKMFQMNNWNPDYEAARFARIATHKQNLIRIFQFNNPSAIVAEDGFFNPGRPNAFAVLIEVQIAIREAVYEYNCWKTLQLIDPPSVKKAVGVSGGSKDKFMMTNGLLKLNDLNYEGYLPLVELDEHSIDAMAVSYCYFKRMCAQ